MRVLEPHYFKDKKPKRDRLSRRRKLLLLSSVVVVVLALGYVTFGQSIKDGAIHEDSPSNSDSASQAPTAERKLRQFTAETFKAAYSSYVYPNTQPITKPPEITGNEEADERIRQVAEARGYKLTSMPVSSIVKTGEPGLEGDDLIQPNALVAWTALKEAAVKDGIKLKMTSAYRSIDYQRTLFLRRMQNAGVNIYTILDGHADDELDVLLSRASIPGYSRHHTGFTIDLSCNGVGLEAFRTTSCYEWLSKNNFEKAKTFGWVPSYPEGAGEVGPEPEPWEFIWIGTARTYE